jgi:hypothetical protein
MKITDNAVKLRRPMDPSDPGFEIPGLKLRWLSGRVAENAPGRPWVILRKQDLPEKLLKHITDTNPAAFTTGDTIRRGDLVLGYASDDANAKWKAMKAEAAAEQYEVISRLPQDARHMKVEHESEDVRVDLGADRFKKPRD